MGKLSAEDVRVLLAGFSAFLVVAFFAGCAVYDGYFRNRPRCPRCSSRRKTEYMGTSSRGKRVFTCNACPWWWTDPQ